jgi:C-terminal processing protease CtpA/Prc
LQARKSPPPPYLHNRAGVVFVPEDFEKSEYLTARVLKGTPAWEANVRDGDVLLKIDDLDATRWRTDPAVKPNGCLSDPPAGTKVRLTLKRGDKEFQTEIVLRDLIGPDVATKKLNEPPR